MATFKTNHSYKVRYMGDSGLYDFITVVKRTAKTITYTRLLEEGEFKARIDASGSEEMIRPDGRSGGTVARATKVVPVEEVTEAYLELSAKSDIALVQAEGDIAICGGKKTVFFSYSEGVFSLVQAGTYKDLGTWTYRQIKDLKAYLKANVYEVVEG